MQLPWIGLMGPFGGLWTSYFWHFSVSAKEGYDVYPGIGDPEVRILSLAVDFIFFSSLAFLAFGFTGHEFAFLPIILAFCGVAVQAFFLQRFRLGLRPQVADTKTCQSCNRAISFDAKICRFCLTGVDEQTASSEQFTHLFS
jgi:hypothetical protein